MRQRAKNEHDNHSRRVDRLHFDWKNGAIVVEDVCRYDWGVHDAVSAPGWANDLDEVENRRLADPVSEPLLDVAWGDEGGPYCPRFIAQDSDYLYFPTKYDGWVTIIRVRRSIYHYVDELLAASEALPYP